MTRGSIGKWKGITENGVQWLVWRQPVTNGGIEFLTTELPILARSVGKDWGVYLGVCSTCKDGKSVVWRSDIDIVWSVEQD